MMHSDILVTIVISLAIHAAIVGFVGKPETRLDMLALPQGGQTLQVNVTLASPSSSKAEPEKDDQNKPADEPEPQVVKKPESVVTTRGDSPNKTVVKTDDERPRPVRKPKPPEPEKKPDTLPPEKLVAKKETTESQRPVTEVSKGNTAQDMSRTADVAGLTDQRPLVTEPLFNGAQRKPAYPYQARKRGQQGTVLLEVFLDKRGHIESVTLVDSSGFSLLDRAAEKAVRRWSFRPLVRDGVALASRVRVPVVFRLDA
ncbi:energy transducer TonB [Kistimonas scapharcae]